MLNKLNFQLTKTDWQIKKEPLHFVFKACQCCTRRVEMWSDNADNNDASSIVSNVASVEPFKMVKTDTTTTYVMAKPMCFLIRWGTPCEMCNL